MNNNIYVNSEGIRNVISNFNAKISTIENIFENENNNIKSIEEKNIWAGELQTSFVTKYQELSSKYDEIISSLKYFVEFMEETIRNNEKLEASLQNNMANNSRDLDVNS